MPTRSVYKELVPASLTIGLALLIIAVGRAAMLFIASNRAKRRLQPWIDAIRIEIDQIDIKSRDLPVQIMPHLLLGDKCSANDLQTLEAFGVTHVLNVAGQHGATDHAATCSGSYLQISAQE